MIAYFAIFAAMIIAGYLLSEVMLRDSVIDELDILLQSSNTDWILESSWGEEDFPVFFRPKWESSRVFYAKLRRSMRKSKYGSSSRLLTKLLRIQDQRQEAKKDLEKGDEKFKTRTRIVLAEFSQNDDFGGFLSRFLEKRHKERVDNGARS